MFPGPLLDALAASPARIAFEHGNRTVSYGSLLGQIRRVAGGLHRAGVRRGHGLALMLPLTPEAFAAHVAAYALGCRVTTGPPGWTPEHVPGWVGTSVVPARIPYGPSLVLDDLVSAADRVPALDARSYDIARVDSRGRAWTYAALAPALDPSLWPPELKRLVSCFARCLVYGTWSTSGMVTFAGRALLGGGTVVIPGLLPVAALERHEITAFLTTAPGLDRLLGSLRRPPPELRAVVVGGAPAQRRNVLGSVLWQAYSRRGSGLISLLPPEDVAARPLPGVEVEIRGTPGRIFVRSPHMTAGYWNDPRRTSAALRDGWLATRDRGHLDPTGLLHLPPAEPAEAPPRGHRVRGRAIGVSGGR